MPSHLEVRISRATYDAAETNGERVQVLLDGIFDACPTTNALEHWDRLRPSHRALLVLEWAMGEIYNGALHQYYSNSTGDTARHLPDAARFFGAEDYAVPFEQANALFAAGTLDDRRLRNAELDRFEHDGREERLDGLTTEIYEREGAGDVIYDHIFRYVEAHPGEFFAADP